MALLLNKLTEGYHYFNEELADPRTNDWFLIGRPWAALAVVGFYLYFVQTLGPKLMEKRQPFKLHRAMQIYNVVQILLCAYLLQQTYVMGWPQEFNLKCDPVDYSYSPKPLKAAWGVYVYFVIKIVDLMDTVFFVLRKNHHQVTFLHLYHHAGMVLGVWGTVKYIAGGHTLLLGIVNSFVHVVMYGYYLMTSMKLSQPWWKKYITQLQLIQFFIIIYHYLQLFWQPNCTFPKSPAIFFIVQNLFMVKLFSEFYYKEYVWKPIMNKAELSTLRTYYSRDKKD